MNRHTRQETGPTCHLVLDPECAHLFEEVNRLLEPRPQVRVVVDRRFPPVGRAPSPPPYPGGLPAAPLPPRPHHLVIRRDCAHLYEDLAPLFAGRSDIQVLVDRRRRSRTPPRSILPGFQGHRDADPPAWLV